VEICLEWNNKTVPQANYTAIKGVSQMNEKGYVWICTVFSGPIPPMPELGDTSDIYLDTGTKTIYIKVKPKQWRSWLLGTCITHPLGGGVGIYPHLNQGIRWQTNVAFTSHRAKFHDVSDMTIEDIFEQTFIYHPYLDPHNAEGVGWVGMGKEVCSRKGKKKSSSVSSHHPTPAPHTVDSVTSPPRDPTPQEEDHHQDITMGFNIGGQTQDINMEFNSGATGEDNPRRALNNKCCCLDSCPSSLPSSPAPLPKPSLLSNFIAAAIPLFKKLLGQAKNLAKTPGNPVP